MAYHLEGKLLEVCTCNVLCPCWIGEDPDNGDCQGMLAWHIDKGTVNGLDVSGRTLAALANIPGNILNGNWRCAFYYDTGATKQQSDALLEVFTGKLGGPMADMAQLVGEVVTVESAPIVFDVVEGKGTLTIGEVGHAELQPYKGATGKPTVLSDTIFSNVPGAPAYVSKASTYRAKLPKLDFNVDLKGHNAIQSTFVFDA